MNKIRAEQGSVLLISLMMLVLLTAIGMYASVNTVTELEITGNDKLHKMAFYAADGGTEVGSELLEQNIAARGFDNTSVGSTQINNTNFWTNLEEPSSNDVILSNIGGHQVSIKIWGDSSLSTGGAVQLISGYEGKGKGASSSGAYLVYDIKSVSLGLTNSRSEIRVKWRHVI